MPKIVVVGGVAGGASVATRIKRLNPLADIVIFERGEHVSFSNCCLPYHLSGTVANSKALIMMTPDRFKKQHDISVRVGCEVIDINREKKTVVVRDLSTGSDFEEAYDKLVLAPGANAILPKSIGGINLPHVFVVRNVSDIRRLKAHIDAVGSQDVAVVGGGFVGLEVAENLREAGKSVSLIEGTDQVMAPLDQDMVQIVHKEMMDKGISLHLSSMVTEITPDSVKAVKAGEEVQIPAQTVVLSIGVAPETALAQKAGLELGERRGIRVNHNYQTNDPDIYAVGDAIEAYDRLARQYGALALAGPAQRQARAAADHICGIHHNNKGYIASSCLRVFEQNVACTGMNEKTAQRAGIPYDVAYVLPADKVSIMPESHYMAFKLIFEVPTGRILGAQAVGKGDVVRRVDVIAAMITMGGTLEDLKELELCYSPVYGTAKDVVNMAALVGLNVLYGKVRQIRVSQVRQLVESGACIIDVREEAEFEAGHLKGAINIPLSQLHQRMNEIPKDVPVYLHCRTSQRSYYACCYLQGNGFRNLYNISGSYLGISLYEYFTDCTTGREPILTRYNFN